MNWSFLYKHWFGTLLLSPFVFDLFCIIDKNKKAVVGLVEVYPITLIISLFFSIPTYILCAIIYYFFVKYEIAVKHLKTIVLAFIYLCILITFHIVFNGREFFTGLAYTLTSLLIGSILQFNFKKNRN